MIVFVLRVQTGIKLPRFDCQNGSVTFESPELHSDAVLVFIVTEANGGCHIIAYSSAANFGVV